jgi:hypothetical protein
MVSRLTVADELAARKLSAVPVKTALPTREFLVVDHPQKHHGAACRATLQLLGQTFPASIHRVNRRNNIVSLDE